MKPETHIHRVADQHRSAFRHAVRMAFTYAKRYVDRANLAPGNAAQHAAIIAKAAAEHLKTTLPQLLLGLHDQAGVATANELKRAKFRTLQASEPFVLVTADYAGLGWAKRLLEDNEQVTVAAKPLDTEDKLEAFSLVAGGLAPVMTLEDALADERFQKAIWVFDHNHHVDVAQELIDAGAKVFPPHIVLGDHLEHDRQAAVEAANESGLDCPPTFEYTDNADGLQLLDQHADKAYVLKPNNSSVNYSTFVPSSQNDREANRQVYNYLKYLPEMSNGFVLQERVNGVEVNVELWFDKGTPFFAFCCLENKRKGERDRGEMCGCASDLVFTVPVNSPLVQRTVGKMTPYYQSHDYTGFADVNVKLGDNKIWFLEVCDRFGYSSHPNLITNLLIDGFTFSDLIRDWLNGTLKGNCYQRFRSGFGASVTGFIDHLRMGLPVTFADEASKKSWFPFDCYVEGGDWMLAGYSQEAGIFMSHGYTIQEATESCIAKLLDHGAVQIPDMDQRCDLAATDYPNAFQKRYDAMKAMGLL